MKDFFPDEDEPKGLRIPSGPAIAVVAVLAIAIVFFVSRRHAAPAVDPGRLAPTPLLKLDSPMVSTLGDLQGPYRFKRATAPDTIVLSGASGAEQTVRLLDLRGEAYPEPTPTPGATPATPTPTPTAEQIKAAQERKQALAEFQMKALGELLGDGPLWALRLSADDAPLVYLFQPTDRSAATAPPKGEANLVQALALRRGVALMVLEGASHPYYEIMLENMEAGIVEARRHADKGKDAPDIWNRFGLRPPPQITAEALKAIESRL